MISIIVPVYNVAPFLKESIESICGQTYTDIEIILVDDGSTDNSGILCDEYMQIDSRIRVIHQENQGLSAARNKGIENAKGDLFMFIDSDDRIHQTMVQVLYDTMIHHDADIVICSHRMIQETEPKESLFRGIEISEKEIEILSGRQCIKKLYTSQISTIQKIDMTVAWNKLYRKSLFSHLKYPVGRLHEDEFVTYKILYSLNKCLYLKSPLYEYRSREGSIMGLQSVRRLKDKMDAFEERYVYFEQNNDMELYCEALRRYETSIAEFILFLDKKQIEKNLLKELNNQFKLVYKEKITASAIPFRHKLKYLLFMNSKMLYKTLKELEDQAGNI